MLLTKETTKALIGYNPVSDRILKSTLKPSPIIQCYAPTSTASDDELKEFYSQLQETMDEIPAGGKNVCRWSWRIVTAGPFQNA